MIGGYIGTPIGGAPRNAIAALNIAVDTHDGFGPIIPPRRVRSQPSKKEQLYQLQQALKALDERLGREREDALLSGQIASEQYAKLLAEQAIAKAQMQAGLLAKARDDEDAIALLMMVN